MCFGGSDRRRVDINTLMILSLSLSLSPSYINNEYILHMGIIYSIYNNLKNVAQPICIAFVHKGTLIGKTDNQFCANLIKVSRGDLFKMTV